MKELNEDVKAWIASLLIVLVILVIALGVTYNINDIIQKEPTMTVDKNGVVLIDGQPTLYTLEKIETFRLVKKGK